MTDETRDYGSRWLANNELILKRWLFKQENIAIGEKRKERKRCLKNSNDIFNMRKEIIDNIQDSDQCDSLQDQ